MVLGENGATRAVWKGFVFCVILPNKKLKCMLLGTLLLDPLENLKRQTDKL